MASPVRKLLPQEVDVIIRGLDLASKSAERAARASPNSVIASEYMKEASIARNLITHFRNHSLEV